MVADDEPDRHRHHTDDRGGHHDRRNPPHQQCRGGGGPDEQPEHEQGADGLERSDDGQRDEAKQHEVRPAWMQSEEGSLLLIEGEHEKRPVEDHRGKHGDDRHGGENGQVLGCHSQHIAEQQLW